MVGTLHYVGRRYMYKRFCFKPHLGMARTVDYAKSVSQEDECVGVLSVNGHFAKTSCNGGVLGSKRCTHLHAKSLLWRAIDLT